MVNSSLYRLAETAAKDPFKLLNELDYYGMADKFADIKRRLEKINDIVKHPRRYQ